MSETIILSVPPAVNAVYLVPSAISAESARELVERDSPGLIAEFLNDEIRELVEARMLVVETRLTTQLPPAPLPLLRAMGAAPAHLEMVERAEQFLLVRATYPPGWPPWHDWAARAVAAVVAAHEGCPVVDTFQPKALSPEEAFASLPGADEKAQLTRWIFVPQSSGSLGQWMTTRGLGRFGLPELQTMNVPPQLSTSWAAVLSGLAVVVLQEWSVQLTTPQPPAFVELPECVEVSELHVAFAYGREPRGDGSAVVKLVFDPATNDRSDSFLTVLPPDDYPASAGEFMASVSDALFGSAASDVRHVQASEAMQEAMQAARDSLPEARRRLTSGELGLQARLMIKYAVPSHGGSEYVWLYVTSWPEPGTILGSWANDAQSDAAIRVGRPATVQADRVADWGIWVDGEGFVEGARTNQLLDEQE